MLERCGKGQLHQENDASLPATYLTAEQPWREQETLTDYPVTPLSCEDY